MTADHQLALWIAHPVLQLAVAAAMVRNKVRRSFPVFFAYIGFQILSFCVLFPINKWGNYTAYFYLYWACCAVNLVLGFMIIHEVFLDVFRPYHTLKDLGSVMFKWAALVMLLVAFVVAASNTGEGLAPILQAILPCNAAYAWLNADWFCFSLCSPAMSECPGGSKASDIAFGLGASAGMELATFALYAGGPISQVTVNSINLVVYNLCILTWFGYMVMKSPARTSGEILFTPRRWEQSLNDLQNPATGDSLIPMFESMVDRALSRSQADYSAGKPQPKPSGNRPSLLYTDSCRPIPNPSDSIAA